MTPEQIAAAKSRAADVVNGFKRVTEQNARDALRLAETLEQREQQIDTLKRRLLANDLRTAANGGRQPGYSEAFSALFGDIFGPRR